MAAKIAKLLIPFQFSCKKLKSQQHLQITKGFSEFLIPLNYGEHVVASGITKQGTIINWANFYYKVGKYSKAVQLLLQSLTGVTNGRDYYKIGQYKPRYQNN